MYRVLISIIICAVLGSCGTRQVRIPNATKRAIDTLAAKDIVVLRPQLDSLCDLRQDSIVQAAMDSIIERRSLEISKIVKK